MSSEWARQCKRLLTGSRVSGAFGDFYDNPDPNIRRRKRQRIYGTVTGACGERKYTVQFDCGKVIDCFSNTLRVENSTASLPPVEIQAAISEAELEGTRAEQANQIIRENEAAANDAIEEEHLPADSPGDEGNDDDADEASANSGTEEPEQRPVGTVSEAPAEDTTTYAGRKQAALRRIAALQDQLIVVTGGRSQRLEWKVISESQPESQEEEEDADDRDVGLKNLSEIARVNYNILIAHLFLKLTFKVSLRSLPFHSFIYLY